MEKSQSSSRFKLQAVGAIHVWKRPLLFAIRKAKNFRGSQLKGLIDDAPSSCSTVASRYFPKLSF